MRLALFGGVTMSLAIGMGSFFSQMTASGHESEAERRKALEQMPYDSQRMAKSQEARLGSMIRDMVEGRSDQHWSAAMRGTVVRHPGEENKTLAADNERAVGRR